ncbi:hypothetical protein C3Y87_17210 [Carbonactinospora thermoautotrophica]|uniref:hypothetical protein n=1 Tax=Carbonactinospora thermoautotrophica TaxID=1469144 RepID=UPI00227165D4|nr:hypothetical protein [Carbonactinospora thermoautotrophica]MCX9193121.1 hypothetical protein [Carbonactinospora thermoautotrophica]
MIVPWGTASREVYLVVDWIDRQPALRALLAEAERAEPDLDFDAFQTSLSNRYGTFSWPSRTEEGRAPLVWKLMRHIAEADTGEGNTGEDPVRRFASGYSRARNLQDCWREFTEDILQPLFDFLSERVGAESSVLRVLGVLSWDVGDSGFGVSVLK